ncbi:hypothetical protein F66182_3451 [Fusarium sp. NRRL 66182]|nr:hypothetical protein F66182_3451 [Fusarium sp. NRRL 66182]
MTARPFATTTLKRLRVEEDAQNSDAVHPTTSSETTDLHSLEYTNQDWEQCSFAYSLHDIKTPNDLTWIDPNTNPQLQHALDVLPPEQQLDALVEAFFSNVNHHYNIIHAPSFIRQYLIWSMRRTQGYHQDLQLTILILMICACATQHLDLDSQTTMESHLAHPCESLSKNYHDAGQSLAAVMPANCFHLNNLQWKVLSVCWLKGEAKFTEAWHTIGSAVQEAYELGLHRPLSSGAASDAENRIGRRAWRVLYCWNWQFSSIFSRPMIINDIGPEPERSSFDLKASPPTPTLHTELEYQLISSLAKRWHSPKNINSATNIRLYKTMIEGWMSSLPSVYDINHPDTAKDHTWPWIVTHRCYIQTMAYFLILQPYKAYMSSPSADSSLPETQQLQTEAVDYSLKTLRAATQWASQVSHGDGQFHLVVLCLFDTAAFLSMTLNRGQGNNTITKKEEAVLAVNGAVLILQQLQVISQGAKSSHRLLDRILTRLKWDREVQ